MGSGRKRGLAQGRGCTATRLGGQALDGSIRLRPAERKALLEDSRWTGPDLRLRAHILLLLDAGRPSAPDVAVLFTSTATINRWRRAHLGGGLDAVLARPGRPRRAGGSASWSGW